LIQLRPNDPNALLDRAEYYHLQLHDYAKALAEYKRASELLPKGQRLATCYNDIASILATCPRAEFRDGKEAIKYATEACKLLSDPDFVDTLAAAHAEAGNFEEAVKLQKEVLKDPRAAVRLELGEGAKTRLRLYESRKPYRQD
jgi:tetratricopeptide (TPR) repeat protein